MNFSVKRNTENALAVCGISDKEYKSGIISAANALLRLDNVAIICHRSPDGDTIGSAAALCRGFISLGKKAKVICADVIPSKYDMLFEGMDVSEFEPQHYVSVDVADPTLLGSLENELASKIEICIDHHKTNKMTAPVKFVDENAAAAGEIIWILLNAMNVKIDVKMAECLFAAISTDTGCFKFSNVTARTHIIAIELMKHDINCAYINFKLIDEETQSGLALKQLALATLDYHCGGRCAIITITDEMKQKTNAAPEDLDGIAAIPRSISGVDCGITMKQHGEVWRISVRTTDKVDASCLCAKFGGGGHKASAGCRLSMSYDEAKSELIKAAEELMEKQGE